MELKTIVCPNCGANTTNHQNCEYCGSFLVQKASLGVDLSDYVNKSQACYDEDFVSVFRKFAEECKHNVNSEVDNILCIFNDETDILNIFVEHEKGMVIALDYYHKSEQLEEEEEFFLKSNVSKVFTADKIPVTDEWGKDSGYHSRYEAIFGYDFEGAALVCKQLLQDVFGRSKDIDDYKIQCAYGYKDELYDINGHPLKDDTPNQHVENNSVKSGCFIFFFLLIIIIIISFVCL